MKNKDTTLTEAAAEIKAAGKVIRDAKKVLNARIKLFNDKALATQLLASKYGQEEASRLVKSHWSSIGKDMSLDL